MQLPGATRNSCTSTLRPLPILSLRVAAPRRSAAPSAGRGGQRRGPTDATRAAGPPRAGRADRGGGAADGSRSAPATAGCSIRMRIRCDLRTHCGRRSPCIAGRARYIANFGLPSARSPKRTTRPISPGCERSKTNCPRSRVRRPTSDDGVVHREPLSRSEGQRAARSGRAESAGWLTVGQATHCLIAERDFGW